MICTEVGELMQRQLDFDLNEQELTTLMTHLSECKDCKELFERLTLLSGSLEQLPRVTPSINIVDSILPELDAIDRQRSAAAKKYSPWMRWATTAASVAAAAAVVFVMSNLVGNSKSSKDLAYEVALSTDTRIAEPGDVMQMSKAASDGADAYHNMMMQDIASKESGDYLIEPMSSPTGGLQPQVEEKEKDNRTSTGTVEMTRNPDNSFESADKPAEPKHPASTEGPTATIDSPRGNQGYFREEEFAEVPPTLPIDQGGFGITGNQGSDAGNMVGSQDHGIAGFQPEVQKNYSPDEHVYVQFEGHIIALYETSTGQLLRTWDMSVAGSATLLGWDMEGKSFMYEVIDVNGESHSFTIKINDEIE